MTPDWVLWGLGALVVGMVLGLLAMRVLSGSKGTGPSSTTPAPRERPLAGGVKLEGSHVTGSIVAGGDVIIGASSPAGPVVTPAVPFVPTGPEPERLDDLLQWLFSSNHDLEQALSRVDYGAIASLLSSLPPSGSTPRAEYAFRVASQVRSHGITAQVIATLIALRPQHRSVIESVGRRGT